MRAILPFCLQEQKTMQPQFESITPTIGAYVHIDAGSVLDEGVPQQLIEALDRYNVLVFPEVHMSDEVYTEMTARMGPMHDLGVTAEKGAAETKAGIYRISLDKDDQAQLDYVRGNDFWHMDGTIYNTPGKATLLKCEVAPSEGGDTGFASLHAAYDALPEARKTELENLRVHHDFRAVGRKLYDAPTDEQIAAWDSIFPPTERPLIWHQKCGRTTMLIGATCDDVIGMTDGESSALIEELNAFATQEEFVYRHAWKKGDVVIFNNPALLHRSYPYAKESGRLMHRTTIAGSEPIE
jgi:alpha-ketoglutarate-dependent taurine dioxygenase